MDACIGDYDISMESYANSEYNGSKTIGIGEEMMKNERI